MVLLLLSACELTTKNESPGITYGEYYLALQQLNQQQLLEEVNKQQTDVERQTNTQNYDAQIKLLLLYSLPESPIYNSFHAKILLNKLNNEDNNAAFATITPSEQAFISLLHDQLNQRLLMRNRLLSQQKEQHQTLQKSQQTSAITQQKNAIEKQQKLIEKQQQLIEQVQLLEQTIKQLKNIEQAIDKRDQ